MKIFGIDFTSRPTRGKPLRFGVRVKYQSKLTPRAAQMDDELYELLAIIDTIRSGRARERKLAIDAFRERLDRYATAK
jgi:hypothetical protein